MINKLTSFTVALLTTVVAAPAAAQTSSLFHPEAIEGTLSPLSLQQHSPYYRQLPPPKQLHVNDLITIRVDVTSQTRSEGEMERRKNALFDAVLRDWVVLKALDHVQPSPQSGDDPRIQGQINQLFRAEGDLETRESVKFNITATIVDIRPNGTLVLEAHAQVRNNNESWEYSLSGICRKEDIGPDNVVLSQHIAELSVYKRERGHVRDSYRRGWALKWWDLLHLF